MSTEINAATPLADLILYVKLAESGDFFGGADLRPRAGLARTEMLRRMPEAEVDRLTRPLMNCNFLITEVAEDGTERDGFCGKDRRHTGEHGEWSWDS